MTLSTPGYQTCDQPGADREERWLIRVAGIVQGVGFRPFVYRLARQLDLTGYVCNTGGGVEIDVDGPQSRLFEFKNRLGDEAPPLAAIRSMEAQRLPEQKRKTFVVEHSDAGNDAGVEVPSDIATCPACLEDIWDPNNRRYLYPFTNCTNCGPRYTIVRDVPYDRHNTTMADFPMCSGCQQEYEDPLNRRFHAEPIACPTCGPTVTLCDPAGRELGSEFVALSIAAQKITAGKIIAVKGLGGFHIVCDARSNEAVAELRRRKSRPQKPFAVMFPSLADVQRHCVVSAYETALLQSKEAPIVLVRKCDTIADDHELAAAIGPDNANNGAFLPYTPLHHILLRLVGRPVVATSANVADEPIVTKNDEALQKLGHIADFFLFHNRQIEHPLEDTVIRLIAGQPTVLRLGRGYAPTVLPKDSGGPAVLAVGGHLKNTIAASANGKIRVGAHQGDLSTVAARRAYDRSVEDMVQRARTNFQVVVRDTHPDYYSSLKADQLGCDVIQAPHHLAHVLSCMTENETPMPAIGVAWDGGGYGLDGTVWGGEFFEICSDGWKRVGRLRSFCLPGGETSVREPRRSALGLLHELDMTDRECLSFLRPSGLQVKEIRLLRQMIRQQINSPQTSSAGRMFDAVACLLNLCHVSTFEGEAATRLETSAEKADSGERYEFVWRFEEDLSELDWADPVMALLADLTRDLSPGIIARKFHNGLAMAITELAKHRSERRVVLSGGCFQNSVLTQTTVDLLRRAGHQPIWHHLVPPNDGGLALGQIAYALLSKRGWCQKEV